MSRSRVRVTILKIADENGRLNWLIHTNTIMLDQNEGHQLERQFFGQGVLLRDTIQKISEPLTWPSDWKVWSVRLDRIFSICLLYFLFTSEPLLTEHWQGMRFTRKKKCYIVNE